MYKSVTIPVYSQLLHVSVNH